MCSARYPHPAVSLFVMFIFSLLGYRLGVRISPIYLSIEFVLVNCLSIDRKFDTVRRAALLLSFLRLFPRELHKTERDVHARPASLPQSYAAGGRLPGE